MARSFFRIPFCLLALSLLSPAVKAAPDLSALSHINGLKIRLVPTHPEPISGLGTKTIEVRQEGPDILVKWFSPTRVQISNTPWPEYKVNLHRGGVHTNGLNEATSMAHPHLWIEGVVQLDQNGLLWVPPKIIEQALKKESFSLEPGFLALSFSLFKKGPPDLIAKIGEFRTTAEAVSDSGLKKFLDEFSVVRATDAERK